MSAATVTSKGQVTIPSDIRKDLAIEAGAKVVFTRLDDGVVIMRSKNRSLAELAGMLKPAGKRRKVPVPKMRIGHG